MMKYKTSSVCINHILLFSPAIIFSQIWCYRWNLDGVHVVLFTTFILFLFMNTNKFSISLFLIIFLSQMTSYCFYILRKMTYDMTLKYVITNTFCSFILVFAYVLFLRLWRKKSFRDEIEHCITKKKTTLDHILNKKAILLDLDGTLYDLHKMRLSMLGQLFGYYIIHFWKIKELVGLFLFRQYKYKKDMDDEQLEKTVEQKLNIKNFSSIRDHWMNEIPLQFIRKYRFDEMIKRINQSDTKVYVYSDYPTEKKLKTVMLQYDATFYPSKNNSLHVKPDKDSIQYVLNHIGLDPAAIVYIGDSDKRDGTCAKMMHIDYYDINEVNIS